MKTLKYLKKALLWDLVFVVSWGLSLIFWALDGKTADLLGTLSLYLWMVNPLPAVYAYKGLRSYWDERKDPVQKTQIGIQWIFLIIGWIITTLVLLFGGGLFVTLTGI